jgi:hypothetical protein
MRANLLSFECYLRSLQYRFPILGLTETWLQNENCSLYSITGYTLVERHRENKTGGGVALLLDNSIQFVERSDLNFFEAWGESVFIEIDKNVFNLSRNVVLGVIYRPPNSDLVTFIDKLNNLLQIIQSDNKICYLLGDYNINMLNFKTHELTSCFVDSIYGNGFIPLISRPTRITSTSATLIDNIFTNDFNQPELNLQGVLIADVTDHFPIFHIRKNVIKRRSVVQYVRRDLSSYRKTNFINELNTIDWNVLYSVTDAQEAFSYFHTVLVTLYNKHFPKVTIRIKRDEDKPWLTKLLINAIKYKHRLYFNFKKFPTVHNELVYKKYRNKLNHLLKAAERKYYRDLIMSNKNNSGKIWSIIKQLINKKTHI